MDKNFQLDLAHLPAHLLAYSDETEKTINELRERATTYHSQLYCLRVLSDLNEMTGPNFTFDMGIDEEGENGEGGQPHFIYCNGEDFGFDEEDFASEKKMNKWVEKRASELEGFAQQLNDYADGDMKEFAKSLVEAMNEHEWAKDQWLPSISQALNEHGEDGPGFVAALLARDLEATTGKSAHKSTRRGL